ncbi:hypothetical protein [Streptomyces sp. NBC_00557]|uniref:hypothetical protein n=1 Tax=Streptomyces sp. NBC_00557 TaxID=2975776 RepID=UPI002E813E3A|nr:hypothetical protein [Streptomyces sp. NBC_00557]WUC36750.1 hypothetical protein OG956_22285 [Streptomyces sp. NBC_00557]
MRLPPPLPPSLRLAAAAASASVVVVVTTAPAAAAAAPPPACAGADARAFPLAARIRGGPPSYEAGGGYGTWYLDLTNTADETCTGIHPVVVLVDDKHQLRPDQPRLEFYDGSRPLPVTFESTDEQELVGVLDGAGFEGFAVPPGKTVSVKLRLALPSDTPSDQVTVNAAVVQRRGDDGDWVGESNAYRFAIGPYGDEPPQQPDATGESAGPSPSGSPRATPGTGTGTSSSGPSLPFAEAAERARELADTGPGLAHGLLAAGAALLAVVCGALVLARRRR